MAKWVALQDGKVVSPASQSQMWSPTKLADGGGALRLRLADRRAPGKADRLPRRRHRGLLDDGPPVSGRSRRRRGVDEFRPDEPGGVAQDVAGLVDPSLARVVAAAIEDKDPEATGAAARRPRPRRRRNPGRQKVLAGAVAGDLGAEGEADAVKSLGKLQKLEPLEREASGGTARRFKYRAAFEHRTMLIHFHLNDEGKIVLMNLEQE